MLSNVDSGLGCPEDAFGSGQRTYFDTTYRWAAHFGLYRVRRRRPAALVWVYVGQVLCLQQITQMIWQVQAIVISGSASRRIGTELT